MTHEDIIKDSDAFFVIDPKTRIIENKTPEKNKLMQYDHNSERYSFMIPRVVEGHDMLSGKIEIHGFNSNLAGSEKNEILYTVKDAQVVTDDTDNIAFSWLISQDATLIEGLVSFVIRFSCINEKGEIEYAWSTDIFSGVMIAKSIYNAKLIVEKHIDVLEQMKAEIIENFADVENGKGVSSIQQPVDALTWATNNSQVIEYIQNSIKTSDGASITFEERMENGFPIFYIKVGAYGKNSSMWGGKSHTVGGKTHAEGSKTIAFENNSHAEGNETFAAGKHSHAEGNTTSALGNSSHAEGKATRAVSDAAHAEGEGSVAEGEWAPHAEGWGTWSKGGHGSHSEGTSTIAEGASSHAEGKLAKAKGIASHAQGLGNTAEGHGSMAAGKGNIAKGHYSMVRGKFAIPDPFYEERDGYGRYADIVGNGTGDMVNDTEFENVKPSNAYTLDWDGNAWFAGSVEPEQGIVLKSPNGTRYVITVDDNGNLSTAKI